MWAPSIRADEIGAYISTLGSRLQGKLPSRHLDKPLFFRSYRPGTGTLRDIGLVNPTSGVRRHLAAASIGLPPKPPASSFLRAKPTEYQEAGENTAVKVLFGPGISALISSVLSSQWRKSGMV